VSIQNSVNGPIPGSFQDFVTVSNAILLSLVICDGSTCEFRWCDRADTRPLANNRSLYARKEVLAVRDLVITIEGGFWK